MQAKKLCAHFCQKKIHINICLLRKFLVELGHKLHIHIFFNLLIVFLFSELSRKKPLRLHSATAKTKAHNCRKNNSHSQSMLHEIHTKQQKLKQTNKIHHTTVTAKNTLQNGVRPRLHPQKSNMHTLCVQENICVANSYFCFAQNHGATNFG